MQRFALIGVLLLASTATFGQVPYAGMQTRPVKTLSEQQIADLNAGRGIGMALVAELNGYPGPSHVLELADKLNLSADQRERIRALFEFMRAEAQPLGSKLIAQETELDRLFASRSIAPGTLEVSATEIAVTQGQLRETHLKYHLATAEILSAGQILKYAELRGYAENSGHHPGHH
jgi:Spy/CpxP family protein refolding chaperone